MNLRDRAEIGGAPVSQDPIGCLVAEMEAIILNLAAEIDRLRVRVQELEAGQRALDTPTACTSSQR